MSKINPLLYMFAATCIVVASAFAMDASASAPTPTTTTSATTKTVAVIIPTTSTVPNKQAVTTTTVPVETTTTTVPQAAVVSEKADRSASFSIPWIYPIPEYYGDGSGCTQEVAGVVAEAMWRYGAYDDDVTWMLKTISRESLCDSSAHNGNRSTGDNSWGLCQLNVLAGFFKPGQILDGYDYTSFAYDVQLNSDACAKLWSVCGRGPWNRGDYYCRQPDTRQ